MIRYSAETTVYAVDLTVYVTGTGVVKKYYATHGGYFDSGAGVNWYEPRLKQPGNFQQSMFSSGATSGASQTGYGEIILINNDGGLDAFINYGLDGRSMVLRKIIAGAATILMSCSMEQPTPTWDTVPIRIKDKQQLFNVPVQPTKYAGDNSLPAGLEGVDDIKGKPKPLLYGEVFNATPVLVNTSRLIYQCSDNQMYDITAVYDQGVALIEGAVYLNQADMEGNEPAPGTYRAWLIGGKGYFRLGSSAAGAVTFDGVEQNSPSARTAAQIAKRLALRAISSGEIDDTDVTALDTVSNSAKVGIYLAEETHISAAIDEVLGSVGAWYGFDAAGVLNMGRLEAPSGSPVVELTAAELLSIERQATSDEGRGLPAWKVNINYKKNYTVQGKDALAGSVTAAATSPGWQSRTLPVSASWRSVAYGGGAFVAVSNSTTAVTSSDGGASWTQRTLPISAAYVCQGNGVFVALAGGSSNQAATSSDGGATWTQRTLPATGYWSKAAYGNGTFVAVTSIANNIAATSPDGITWTQRTLPASADWQGVTYGNGTFVAVAKTSNIAATSPDGITWTQRTLPASAAWSAVQFSNNIFVAANDGSNSVAISSVGVDWQSVTMPVSTAQQWREIAACNGVFMMAAYSSAITAMSGDGTGWTFPALPGSVSIQAIAGGDGSFVALALGTTAAYTYTLSPLSAYLQFSGKEYRTVTASDAAILTKHPTARELNLNTLLVSATAAQTEADRQLALRKVDRDYLQIKVPSAVLPADLLGRVLKITIPRYGYDAGKLFRVLGASYDYELETTTLDIWG